METPRLPAAAAATNKPAASKPPLVRLGALLSSVGALSSSPTAAEVLNTQQQQQLQHELQQLLLQHLAAAQQEGRAVAAPLSVAAEMEERAELFSELHEILKTAAAPPSLISQLAALLLSREQQPLQRPHAILKVLLLLSRSPEFQASRKQHNHAAAAAAGHAGREKGSAKGFTANSNQPASSAATEAAGAAEAKEGGVLAQSQQHLAMSLSHQRAAANSNSLPLVQQREVFSYDIWGADEIAVLRDLLFILQGIDGRFIRFDVELQTAQICPPVKASRSVLGLVARVAALGCMYTRVKAFIEGPKTSFLSSRPLTAEAFRQGIAAEVQQYFKLIAILEEDISRAEALQNAPTAAAAAATAAAQSSTPTLRRLAVWLQGPYQRMRLLTSLTEAAKGLKGAALLSTIYAYCSTGDSELRAVALQILHRSFLPMADAIEGWTKYGHLRDESGEFFIREAPQDPQQSSWRSRFVLVRENIPSFMPPLLPERLLLAGKSVLYSQLLERPVKATVNPLQQRELPATLQELLSQEEQQKLLQSPEQQDEQQQQELLLSQRFHSQDLASRQQQQQQLLLQQEMLRQPHDPELPLLQKIDARVAAASTKGNQRLVALLLWEHQLLSCLEAIRRFLLLADGDFTSQLLDAAAQQQQQQHGGSISLQPLILSAIDTAARQCSSGASLFAAAPSLAFALTARFPHTSYLQQQNTSGSSGGNSSNNACSALWRGLVLHLRIEEPLRFFIGDELLQLCHKMFALLWKSHQTHRQLHSAWLRGGSLQKQLRQQQRAAAAAAAAERASGAAAAERSLVSRATAAAREEILIMQIAQLTHLLSEMLHFSRHWLDFAHQDILRPNWTHLYKAIPKCRDVDEFLELLWQCIQQQHDGLFLYGEKEAAAAASAAAAGGSGSISVQLHKLIQEMHDTCSSMASRAEFRFAAAAEEQLRGPHEDLAPADAAVSSSSSSSSMIMVEEQRQLFRQQVLRLLLLLDSKQSEVRAAAAAAAQATSSSSSSSSSRSRMHLDHCMAIRSLCLRLDFNDFYEHQRQMQAAAPHQRCDTAVPRFPSFLLQQQLSAATTSSSSSRSNSNARTSDKRSDGFNTTPRVLNTDEAGGALPGGPVFISKLQQQLQQQQQQPFAEELTRPPTACEASGPSSPLP